MFTKFFRKIGKHFSKSGQMGRVFLSIKMSQEIKKLQMPYIDILYFFKCVFQIKMQTFGRYLLFGMN